MQYYCMLSSFILFFDNNGCVYAANPHKHQRMQISVGSVASLIASLSNHDWSVEALKWQHTGGHCLAARRMSVTVLCEMVAADELTTADRARVAFLTSVAASVTRQLVGPSKSLLTVRPRTGKRLLTCNGNKTNHNVHYARQHT